DFQQVYANPVGIILPALISQPNGTAGLQSNTNDSAIGSVALRSNDSPTSISADGRFTTFASVADDLAPDDDNTLTNVFVPDALTDTTTLVNRASGTSGAAANGISGPVFRHVPVLPSGTPAGTPPAISANGQVVAFTSTATNLVPGDTNNHLDVFVR